MPVFFSTPPVSAARASGCGRVEAGEEIEVGDELTGLGTAFTDAAG